MKNFKFRMKIKVRSQRGTLKLAREEEMENLLSLE